MRHPQPRHRRVAAGRGPPSVVLRARVRLVQLLQEPVRRQLDVLVAPLRGAVDARDEPAAVDLGEVAVDEGVPRLGLVVGVPR